jgi:hypothetical protein
MHVNTWRNTWRWVLLTLALGIPAMLILSNTAEARSKPQATASHRPLCYHGTGITAEYWEQVCARSYGRRAARSRCYNRAGSGDGECRYATDGGNTTAGWSSRYGDHGYLVRAYYGYHGFWGVWHSCTAYYYVNGHDGSVSNGSCQ